MRIKTIAAIMIIIESFFGNIANSQTIELSKTDNYIENYSWNGKEWISDNYPPHILGDDGQEYKIQGYDELIDSDFGPSNYKYVWTGSDYLMYRTSYGYTNTYDTKYLYRISEDFLTVLDKYIIPNGIYSIENIDGRTYIATHNIVARRDKDTGKIYGTYGVDYTIYYSDDLENWIQLDNEFFLDQGYGDGDLKIFKINNKLLIRLYDSGVKYYLYTPGQLEHIKDNEIIYENAPITTSYYKIGNYLCAPQNGNDSKSIMFSEDGVYWQMFDINLTEDINKIDYRFGKIIVSQKSLQNPNNYDYYEYDANVALSIINHNENPVYVKFNDNILGFETAPVIEDGRTLVPMRFLFEQMGADVEWDQATQTATATMNNTAVAFAIDDTNAEVNGSATAMDVPARLVNGKTMVPLRFLSEKLEYTVTWDEETRTAIITNSIDAPNVEVAENTGNEE